MLTMKQRRISKILVIILGLAGLFGVRLYGFQAALANAEMVSDSRLEPGSEPTPEETPTPEPEPTPEETPMAEDYPEEEEEEYPTDDTYYY